MYLNNKSVITQLTQYSMNCKLLKYKQPRPRSNASTDQVQVQVHHLLYHKFASMQSTCKCGINLLIYFNVCKIIRLTCALNHFITMENRFFCQLMQIYMHLHRFRVKNNDFKQKRKRRKTKQVDLCIIIINNKLIQYDVQKSRL